MEIIKDFDEKSYNNNDKPWKLLRILRDIFCFSFFFCIFLVFHVFHFSFCSFSFLCFSFFFFSFDFTFHLSLLTFFGCPSRRQKLKNSREILVIKMTIFLCENLICGSRWTGRVRNGPSEGDPASMFFISFFFFLQFFNSFLKKYFLFLFQICFTVSIGIRV